MFHRENIEYWGRFNRERAVDNDKSDFVIKLYIFVLYIMEVFV